MRRASILSPDFTFDAGDPEGFRAGLFRPGKELGARRTGMSVYELPPGQAICPYHYELGEEEWLLVLEGSATVRHPDGEDVLGPFEVAFFPPGAAGAHSVRNATDAVVRVLMFSDVVHPTATVYPDSDKVGVWTEDRADNVMVRRSPQLDYYEGETGPAGAT